MKQFKQYAKLKDEQFSLYELYARKHGLNYKSLLVLLWLYNMPNGVTQKKLCDKTFSTKQVIYAIIQVYIKKGYVSLEPSPDDQRSKQVRLTQTGKEYARTIIEPLDVMEERALSSLSKKQMEQLLLTTSLFTQHLKKEMEVE